MEILVYIFVFLLSLVVIISSLIGLATIGTISARVIYLKWFEVPNPYVLENELLKAQLQEYKTNLNNKEDKFNDLQIMILQKTLNS